MSEWTPNYTLCEQVNGWTFEINEGKPTYSTQLLFENTSGINAQLVCIDLIGRNCPKANGLSCYRSRILSAQNVIAEDTAGEPEIYGLYVIGADYETKEISNISQPEQRETTDQATGKTYTYSFTESGRNSLVQRILESKFFRRVGNSAIPSERNLAISPGQAPFSTKKQSVIQWSFGGMTSRPDWVKSLNNTVNQSAFTTAAGDTYPAETLLFSDEGYTRSNTAVYATDGTKINDISISFQCSFTYLGEDKKNDGTPANSTYNKPYWLEYDDCFKYAVQNSSGAWTEMNLIPKADWSIIFS